jgi:hypothetical protein
MRFFLRLTREITKNATKRHASTTRDSLLRSQNYSENLEINKWLAPTTLQIYSYARIIKGKKQKKQSEGYETEKEMFMTDA